MPKYYSSVTFPASARRIKEIDSAVSRMTSIGQTVHQGLDGLVQITDDKAKNGDMAITDLLQEFNVPYDHFHRDDEAMNSWTEHHRLDSEGDLIQVERSTEAGNAVAEFASEVLGLMQSGDTEKVYQQLRDAADAKCAPIVTLAGFKPSILQPA